VIGLTTGIALDYAQLKIRINAVAPWIIDTSMIRRFSGGAPEGGHAMISQEPVGRMVIRKRLPQPFSIYVRVQLPS
jgi:NAD(P)-dependent dehydrogenase (short-subunit alcohol dehydrogenase family)